MWVLGRFRGLGACRKAGFAGRRVDRGNASLLAAHRKRFSLNILEFVIVQTWTSTRTVIYFRLVDVSVYLLTFHYPSNWWWLIFNGSFWRSVLFRIYGQDKNDTFQRRTERQLKYFLMHSIDFYTDGPLLMKASNQFIKVALFPVIGETLLLIDILIPPTPQGNHWPHKWRERWRNLV